MTILGRPRTPAPDPGPGRGDPPEDAPEVDEVDEFGLFAAGLSGSDAAAAVPAAAAAGPAVAPPAPAGRRSRWPLAACAVLAAVAVAAALLGLQQRNTLQADRSLNSELRSVSGRTVAALTTYDYQHLDQWRNSVMANLTGSFQNTFTSSVAGYEQVYVASHNRGTSTVEGVWVGQSSAGQVTTVVLVRITVTSLTGTHTIEPYVQLTLLKVGGRWRVDDVQYTIESAAGSTATGSGAPQAAPTPTTTVP